MKLLLLSCIFIGGVAVSSALDPLPNKAGTCPPPPRIGTCDERCSGDDSCQGRQKCCSHGCGHSCQDPVRTDICALPKVVGPCDAAVRSWWFNKAKGRCEFFSYGGCQGNANRFNSKRACEDRCQEVVPVPLCKQPQKIGPCRARKSRWYFNAARGRCEQFFWGGCAPNGNNFMTVEECRRTCPEVVPVTPCKQPKKVEPCYARIPRWYFNAASSRCEQFFWGGCAPNGNNFMTVEECRRTCPEEVPACEQPLKVGPCRAAVQRWYYNSAKSRCEKFSWGGCKANDNNFLTVDECIRSCPEKSSRPHTGQCARQDFSSRPFIDCAPSTSGCRADHHCAGDEKCCEQLCYDFQCKPAVMRPLVKPGRCPAVRFKTRANSRCYWRNTCIQNSQCPGNKKCCQAPGPSRCKTCQNPQVHYRG